MQTPTVRLFPVLPIRPVTRRLAERLLFDVELSPAMMTDFGVTSEAHYRALKGALCAPQSEVETETDEDVTALVGLYARLIELDRALGHGPRLTAFVRKYAPHAADTVRFHTVWDTIYGRKTKP